MEKYVIRVLAKEDCFIAEWDGDPGRTLNIKSAKVWPVRGTAVKALNQLRKDYPDRRFAVVLLDG